MKRTFYNAGHGAFYVEDFGSNGPVVVYDCGSSSPGKYHIERIVKDQLYGRNIEAVFISHFHSDHICGLEYLLKYCTVEKIYLPLLTESERVLLYAAQKQRRNVNTFSEDLILRPLTTIRGRSPETKVFGVLPIHDPSSSPFDGELSRMDGVEPSDGLPRVASGEPVMISNMPRPSINVWEYVPFNYRYAERYDKVVDELVALGYTADGLFTDLYYGSNSKKNAAISIVKQAIIDAKISSSFNSHTMTLFSGCSNKKLKQYIKDAGYLGVAFPQCGYKAILSNRL